MILAEEVEQLGAQADAGVESRIGARDVRAQLDQVLGIAARTRSTMTLTRSTTSRSSMYFVRLRPFS